MKPLSNEEIQNVIKSFHDREPIRSISTRLQRGARTIRKILTDNGIQILHNSTRKRGEGMPPWKQTARSIWKTNYSDGCSFEKFLELSQYNCHYCGALPSNTTTQISSGCDEEYRQQGKFTYNGLDRIDSSKDHSENNILPACKICNFMKNKMGYKEFTNHICRIHKNLYHEKGSTTT